MDGGHLVRPVGLFLLLLSVLSKVVAETCRDGELRLDNVQRNYIGEGVLEICRGLNTSGGQEGGIWRKVCLLELNYVTPSPIQILPAQVACRHLQSQNNWDFNISDAFLRSNDYFHHVQTFSYTYSSQFVYITQCRGSETRLDQCNLTFSSGGTAASYSSASCYYVGVSCLPSDESILPLCSNGEYRCKNGFCIKDAFVCDVHNNQDCGDGSDESSEACYEKELEAAERAHQKAQRTLSMSVGLSVAIPLSITAIWLVILAVCMFIPRCPLGRIYHSKADIDTTGHTSSDPQSDEDSLNQSNQQTA